jgi:nitrogen fixation NifU-like protein
MYSAQVLDHYRHPRNHGELPDADVYTETTNPVCGDLLKLWAQVEDGMVKRATFRVDGCIPAVACASRLTEMLAGHPLGELERIRPEDVEASLGGLPPAARHASVLAVDGLKRLLALAAQSRG